MAVQHRMAFSIESQLSSNTAAMEIDLTTPALMFSTVSLLLLAFTTRFLGLAKAIRDLYNDYQKNPEKRFIDQLKNFRRRVELIRNMQIVATASLLLCMVSTIMIYFQLQLIASVTFAVSLLLMTAALAMSIIEIGMSVGALNVHLADMEQALSSEETSVSNWEKFTRRLGRFSMTSTLWLCVVIALLFLWMRDHRELQRLLTDSKVSAQMNLPVPESESNGSPAIENSATQP